MSDRVTISISGGVADVRLNRPDKRNALDNAMFIAIAEAGAQLQTEPGVRVVVLSGVGASFCAGLDFSSFQSMTGNTGSDNAASDDGTSGDRTSGDTTSGDKPAPTDATATEGSPGSMKAGRITHLGQQVAWVWQEIPVPVIAAVHGHALGGGLQIALGADIRIAHPDTKLSVREVHWGLVPDMTGTQILAGLVRPDIAKELTFTARVFGGREAFELGVVTRLSDRPLDEAFVIANEIAGRSPDAVRGSKELFNRIVNAGAAEQFAEERRVIGSLIGRPNQVEAVMANFENRSPEFT